MGQGGTTLQGLYFLFQLFHPFRQAVQGLGTADAAQVEQSHFGTHARGRTAPRFCERLVQIGEERIQVGFRHLGHVIF